MKENREIKKGLCFATKKCIINRAMDDYNCGMEMTGDKRKDVYDFMVNLAKFYIISATPYQPVFTGNLVEVAGSLKNPAGLKNDDDDDAMIIENASTDNVQLKDGSTEEEAKKEENEDNSKTNKNKTKRNTPQSILRTKDTPSQTPMYLSHIDIRATMMEATEKDRLIELRELIDDAVETIRSTGTTTLIVPKMNPDGKAVRQVSSKKFDNTNRGVTWRQTVTLPNIKHYTNDWVAKPSKWDTTTIQLSIKTSKPINTVYNETAIPLLTKGLEIFTRRRSIKKVDNVPIGGLLSSFNSLDHRALSFAIVAKHNLYMSFETVKIVNGNFSSCGVRDTECNGFIVCVADDDVNKGLSVMKKEWPAFAKKDKYMLGICLHAYPFDHTRKFHKNVITKFPNIPLCMLSDYQHSMIKAEDGGGSIKQKFIRSVESLTIPITTRVDEITTTLREFITCQREPYSKRPYIASVCPIQTQGKKKSVFTLFTTYRSGCKTRTKDIATSAIKYVDEKLAADVWNTFGRDEATKVLAPAICQRLALRNSVSAADVPALSSLFSEVPETSDNEDDDDAGDDATLASAYDNVTLGDSSTVRSDLTGDSGKTTGSTRKRLSRTMEANEVLNLENEEMKSKQKSMEQEIIDLRRAVNTSLQVTKQPENGVKDLEMTADTTTNEDVMANNDDETSDFQQQSKQAHKEDTTNQEVGGLSPPETSTIPAAPAKDDSSDLVPPESNSHTEPTPQGGKAKNPPLDMETSVSRYPTRVKVTARGATNGAAGRD